MRSGVTTPCGEKVVTVFVKYQMLSGGMDRQGDNRFIYTSCMSLPCSR